MKHIFVNLKRFDVPRGLGGVNSVFPPREYGSGIIEEVKRILRLQQDTEYVFFFPESDLIPALIKADNTKLRIGCQGVYIEDVCPGGNFGAFTTHRVASSMVSLGVNDTIIGHIEERNNLRRLFSLCGNNDPSLIDKELNREVIKAQERNMRVLFCVGEREDEIDFWQETIKRQLSEGLNGAAMSNVVIAYEPVWSIGPGKTPAGKDHIKKVACLIKDITKGADVVYGGGLKTDNATMLSSIDEISGGLIALTRFTGEIGFYAEDFKQIVDLYLGGKNES